MLKLVYPGVNNLSLLGRGHGSVELSVPKASGASGYPMDSVSEHLFAAFSVRRLLTDLAYADPVRMRDASIGEADIPFAPSELDVDSTARAALLGGGNGSLVTWYDQRTGWDVTNAVTTAQPIVQTSGTPVTLNGRQAASTRAGTVPHMRLSGACNHNIGTGDFFVSAIVCKAASAVAYSGIAGFNNYAPSFYTKISSNDKPGMYFGGDKVFGTTLVDGTHYVISFAREAGTLYCWVNGALDPIDYAVGTSIANGTITVCNDAPVGSGVSPVVGPMQEILFFTTAMAADRAAIMANQMTFAGL